MKTRILLFALLVSAGLFAQDVRRFPADCAGSTVQVLDETETVIGAGPIFTGTYLVEVCTTVSQYCADTNTTTVATSCETEWRFLGITIGEVQDKPQLPSYDQPLILGAGIGVGGYWETFEPLNLPKAEGPAEKAAPAVPMFYQNFAEGQNVEVGCNTTVKGTQISFSGGQNSGEITTQETIIWGFTYPRVCVITRKYFYNLNFQTGETCYNLYSYETQNCY